MTALAPTLQSFFSDYLIGQRAASGHTIGSYRDTFRLLLSYAQQRTGKRRCDLDISDLSAELVADFLTMLETERHNTPRTRNVRLAAVHSFFNHAALRHPEHANDTARVLAIAAKNTRRDVVNFLNDAEIEALLHSPDRDTWVGRRDHTLMLLMVTTGLRVSEATALTRADVCAEPRRGHIAVTGKGRKQRITPLDQATCKALRLWLTENPGPDDQPVFAAQGSARRLSTDAVANRVALYAAAASATCATLATKNVTPHVLRHSCAMRMRAAGLDITSIALWLGHESPEATRPYLHADLDLKQKALDRTAPPRTKPGRYRPPDKLLAFLEAL
jgi:site-specific recombinase XerD